MCKEGLRINDNVLVLSKHRPRITLWMVWLSISLVHMHACPTILPDAWTLPSGSNRCRCVLVDVYIQWMHWSYTGCIVISTYRFGFEDVYTDLCLSTVA